MTVLAQAWLALSTLVLHSRFNKATTVSITGTVQQIVNISYITIYYNTGYVHVWFPMILQDSFNRKKNRQGKMQIAETKI